MIAAPFWSVALVVLGGGFAVAAVALIVRVVRDALAYVADDVVPAALVALLLLVLAAVCIGGGVAIGTVAWP